MLSEWSIYVAWYIPKQICPLKEHFRFLSGHSAQVSDDLKAPRLNVKGAHTCEASSDKGEQPPGGSRVPSGVISLSQSHSRIARALVVVMTSTWTRPWIYTLLVSASEPASWFEWPQCVENIQQDVLDEPWSSGTHKALCFPRTTWCDEDRLNWLGWTDKVATWSTQTELFWGS